MPKSTDVTHLDPTGTDTAAPGSDTCQCSSRPDLLHRKYRPPGRSWQDTVLSSRHSTLGGHMALRGHDTADLVSSAGGGGEGGGGEVNTGEMTM